MTLPEYREHHDKLGESDATVGEFWRWAMSDLLGNRNRGIFAEFLVGKALGDKALEHPRIEWDCYDIEYHDYWIEVKSSAYIQTWHNENTRKSALSFNISPTNRCWDARRDIVKRDRKRYAHMYVFCVLNGRDVLDLDNWDFYVTTTANMENSVGKDTGSIGIRKVHEICGQPIPYNELKPKIDALLRIGIN